MSSKSKSSTTVDMGPWKVQAPYLSEAFSEAKNLYNDTKSKPGYTGEFYAPQTATQKALNDTALNYYTGKGLDSATEIYNASSGLAQQGGQGLVDASTGLYGLATGDSTGANIDAAKRYASGVDLDGLTNAATYGARRQAAEGTIPNLYRTAAATGNLNSDRTALAQGVVERGLAENAQNIRSQLGADMYTQGLTMAQGDQAQQAKNLESAGSLADTLLARGAGGLADAFNMQSQSLGNASNYAGMQQDENQKLLENEFQKQQYAENRPYDLLNRYYSTIGATNWGQNGTTTTESTTTPSAASVAGGIIGGLGSMLGGMGPFGAFGALGGAGAGTAAAGLTSNAASASTGGLLSRLFGR